jgi:two-component system OmpR family response regulator
MKQVRPWRVAKIVGNKFGLLTVIKEAGRMKCPCCGTEMESKGKPVVCLNTNKLSVAGTTIQLTGRQAEVISLLVEAMPAPVSHERMIARVYGADPILDADATLKQYVSQIRKKVACFGLQIRTIHGSGYALEPT